MNDKGLKMLLRVESYLFRTGYTNGGFDYSRAHAFWDAVNIVRKAERRCIDSFASIAGNA